MRCRELGFQSRHILHTQGPAGIGTQVLYSSNTNATFSQVVKWCNKSDKYRYIVLGDV